MRWQLCKSDFLLLGRYRIKKKKRSMRKKKSGIFEAICFLWLPKQSYSKPLVFSYACEAMRLLVYIFDYTWLDSDICFNSEYTTPQCSASWLLIIFTTFNVFFPTLVRNALCNSCLRVIIVSQLDQLPSQITYSAAVSFIYIFNNKYAGHLYIILKRAES